MVATLPLILAGTSAIGAGVSLFDVLTRESQFEDAGPTAAQRQALGLQAEITGRMLGQTGMSAADVQKVQQVQQGQQQQNLQAITALQQSGLSAFDRQRVADALTSEIAKTQQKSKDVLSLLDVGAEAKRLQAASRSAAAMAAQAEQVRAAETQKQILKERERASQAAALQKIFSSLGKTAAFGFSAFEDTEATSGVPAHMKPETLTTKGLALDSTPSAADAEVTPMALTPSEDLSLTNETLEANQAMLNPTGQVTMGALLSRQDFGAGYLPPEIREINAAFGI